MKAIFFLVGGLFLITGLLIISDSILNADDLFETKITKIDCFDRYGNKIIGLTCEKYSDGLYVLVLGTMLSSFGLAVITLGFMTPRVKDIGEI